MTITTWNHDHIGGSINLVNTFKEVNNVDVKYQIKERRKGDIDACYADATYALNKFGWKAEKTLEDMCRDAYNYIKFSQNNNR